ncbi:transcriptional regulator [Streptomyces sp. SAT1]|nr:transcriptional regulator [Streptomyces sp. SAT1]
MPLDLARHADQRLGTDGFFERRCEDVAKARNTGHPMYFLEVPELEKQATSLEEWHPDIFPGLLQTEEYFRGLARYMGPLTPPEKVEERVRGRMARAELWRRADRPTYWGIVTEEVVRGAPLPPAVMAAQLEHVVDLMRATKSILQIIPGTTLWHPLKHGMAKIMTFADAPPLVWSESDFDGRIIDYPPRVTEYRRRYDLLRATALPPDASIALIEEAARTYRHEAEQGD